MECNRARESAYLLALTKVEGMTLSEAARVLCISRQGLYKIAKKLKNKGYLEDGHVIKLSNIAHIKLQEILRDLLKYFNINILRFTGYVTKGLGEGAFYLSLEG